MDRSVAGGGVRWMGLCVCVMLVGCKKQVPGVPAIMDPGRTEHFFDWPFPSDEMRNGLGQPDLSGFPIPESDPARGLVAGWVNRAELATTGFGNNTSAYFRFEGPLALPESTPGEVMDLVVWVAVDGSEQLPLSMRFVEDPVGDPFFGANTLAITPELGSPARSGGTYVAAVMVAAGAEAPQGYLPPQVAVDALAAAGVEGEIAVATVFTLQDPVAELQALAADVTPRLNFDGVVFREVVALSYALDTTPSGEAATRATATFADGGTSDAWLGDGGGDFVDHTVDLTDWPMVVYEAEIQTWNYQGLADRPYMSPGFAHIADTELLTGWMDVDGGEVGGEPEAEPMRIVLSIPRDAGGGPGQAIGVVVHDHGTGGHAYSIVQRMDVEDNGRAINQRFADAGWAIIGRDASLYGTRWPLIDEGYDASLGFYNIVNPPAFRDNQRQTALDGHVLRRYIAKQLSADLPGGSVDTSRVRRTGHSLGSVTGHLGMAMAPDDWERGFVTGTGGVFTLYFLDSGLLESLGGGELTDALFALIGGEVPESPTTRTVLAAILGLDEAATVHMDRQHPALGLFQWQMDPSDPMAVAREESVPMTLVISPGDFQTPDFTAEALSLALPDSKVVHCQALGDYDPHYCYWREAEGHQHLADWLAY